MYNLDMKKLSIILTIFLTQAYMCSHAQKYTANVELSAKKGITGKSKFKRDIGRLGLLFPFWQHESAVAYFTAIGMKDTKHSIEGNFGVGLRKIINNSYILGTYGFYDVRNTPNNNNLHQITMGAEYLTHNFETRLNLYVPINEKILSATEIYDISYDPKFTRTKVGKSAIENVEKGLIGVDVEVGGSLPAHTNLSAYIAYYYFDAKDAKAVYGPRARAKYTLADWLSLEYEASFDSKRKFISSIGINLNWRFGAKNSLGKQIKLSRIEQKMTQLPVRDVDIVSQVLTRTRQTIKPQEVSGRVAIFLAPSSKKFVINNPGKTDIHFLGENFNQVEDDILYEKNGRFHLASKSTDIPEEIAKVVLASKKNGTLKNIELNDIAHIAQLPAGLPIINTVNKSVMYEGEQIRYAIDRLCAVSNIAIAAGERINLPATDNPNTRVTYAMEFLLNGPFAPHAGPESIHSGYWDTVAASLIAGNNLETVRVVSLINHGNAHWTSSVTTINVNQAWLQQKREQFDAAREALQHEDSMYYRRRVTERLQTPETAEFLLEGATASRTQHYDSLAPNGGGGYYQRYRDNMQLFIGANGAIHAGIETGNCHRQAGLTCADHTMFNTFVRSVLGREPHTVAGITSDNLRGFMTHNRPLQFYSRDTQRHARVVDAAVRNIIGG